MIGQTIKHYEIKELIGRGAMGTVYRAHDKALDRDVAIKFLSSETDRAPEEIERFFREARAAAGLNHPNVVVIHDVGEHGGSCYFVMELLKGSSLRQMIRGGKPPGWREGMKIVIQILGVLEAASASGLLHRDIKPDNIWITPGGHVKVLDFGIVRSTGTQTLTLTGEAIGTPEYMAPEQIMGERLDGRTDLYALGILIFELLTGQLPFEGLNAVTVIYKQMEEDPTPPSRLRRDLPLAVEKMILKAMAKEPKRRYPSARVMREEIQALLEGRQVEEERVSEGDHPTEPPLRKKPLRFECRLVGREKELDLLKVRVKNTLDGRGGAILISGEAGIGKSRLATEAIKFAGRGGCTVLQGSCIYSEGREPYLPFIEALGHCLEGRVDLDGDGLTAFIRDETPELERLTSRLMTVIRTRRISDVVNPAEKMAASKEELFEAILKLLLFLAREKPVIILLEDLQWGDSGSIDLFYYLSRNVQEQPLLIVGTFRTEDLLPEQEGTPHPLVNATHQMSREGVLQKVDLQGLGMEAVNLMVRFIFRRSMFSPDFRESLFHETGGNPFFVIEVLKLLRDEGVIFDRRGAWREKRTITRADIPDRVYDVIVRRIDRLKEDHRELLQIASVGGERFASGILSSVAEQKRVRVLQALNRLERQHQLIRSEGEAYVFTHAKIREILYDEINPELRREYHAAYGNYLKEKALPEGKEPVVDLARHFFYGGAADKALPYLIRAGDRAEGLFAFREARDCYRKALEILPKAGEVDDSGEDEPFLIYKIGSLDDRLGDIPAAMERLSRAERLAEAGDHPRILGEVQQWMSIIQFRMGRFDLATEGFRRSAENFKKVGDGKALCEVLVRAAHIPFEQGDWKSAQSYYTRGLRIAKKEGYGDQIAKIYLNSGIMASIRGQGVRAMDLYEKSRKIYKELGDRPGLALVYLNQGWSLSGKKEWKGARDAYRRALTICRKTRNISMEAKCYVNLAEVMLEASDLKGCKRACLTALEIFKRLNKPIEIADVYKTLGQAAAAERKWEDARTCFEKSISTNEKLNHALYSGKAHLEYARMLKDMGDLIQASEEVDRSIAWFDKIKAKEELKIAKGLKRDVEAMQYLAEA